MKKILLLTTILTILASTARANDDGGVGSPHPGLGDSIAAAEPDTAVPSPTGIECPKGVPHCIVAYRFLGEITPKGVAAFTQFLKEANAIHAEMVFVEINSEGGSFDAGVFMAREIEMSKVPVTCVVDGTADSMGA